MRRTVGIVTAHLDLALLAVGSLPTDIETHTHLSWDDHGVDAFGCDLTLIGADLARECPVRAVTDTVYVIAPDLMSLPVGAYTDATTIGARVLTLFEDRNTLWHLATGTATEGSAT